MEIKQLKCSDSRELHKAHCNKLTKSTTVIHSNWNGCHQLVLHTESWLQDSVSKRNTRVPLHSLRTQPYFKPTTLLYSRWSQLEDKTQIVSQINVMLKTNVSKRRHEIDPLEDHL